MLVPEFQDSLVVSNTSGDLNWTVLPESIVQVHTIQPQPHLLAKARPENCVTGNSAMQQADAE
jgi:hypothetical protein